MHYDFIYAYIHKHHHRQSLPKRGYWDAGNEHPIEQIIGTSLFYFTIHIVSYFIPLHIGLIATHFVLYAALAFLNHTPYDISFNWLGFKYQVRDHSMHHRHPKCNMAQYFMWWDMLAGTYREYNDGSKNKK
jgi:sterol desaturase/sphingolipid hydroxylase (fatty acid hydroxylase superfamily)